MQGRPCYFATVSRFGSRDLRPKARPILSSRAWKKENRRERRGEPVDKGLKLPFSPFIINLVIISLSMSNFRVEIRRKIKFFLQLFVNGVKWSGFCKYVKNHLLVVLKD